MAGSARKPSNAWMRWPMSLMARSPNAAAQLRTARSPGHALIREWRGVEHCVTVRQEDFEYQGRPYKSLSAIARQITGTQWNGLVFFGMKNTRGRS